jgi:ribosome recycling factor
MIDGIIKEVKPRMKVAIENLANDLSRIRTGRANPAILDGIMVSYYGTNTPIKEVATISVPESNQITVKPWDRGALAGIETAIRNSDIGINPINDGMQIRLVLPPMTEERRKEIVITVKKYGEEAKIALRNIRKDAWDKVQAALKNNEATEDDKYWAEEELNKAINEMNKEVDQVVAEKEKEVMKI